MRHEFATKQRLCPTHIETGTMALAFEKGNSFTVKSISKETGRQAQICLPDTGFEWALRDFSTGSSWTTDPLLLKGSRVQILVMLPLEGETSVLGVIAMFSLLCWIQLHDLQFVLLSLKNNSVSCKKQDSSSLIWFCSNKSPPLVVHSSVLGTSGDNCYFLLIRRQSKPEGLQESRQVGLYKQISQPGK